jgi:hypothetical protein
MRVYIEPRREEGWLLQIKTETKETIRYVIPAEGKFRMVNPYDTINPRGVVCETLELAIEEAKKTVDN